MFYRTVIRIAPYFDPLFILFCRNIFNFNLREGVKTMENLLALTDHSLRLRVADRRPYKERLSKKDWEIILIATYTWDIVALI